MRGWYGASFGLAFFATSNLILFAFLTLTAARKLNEIDTEKLRATLLLERSERLRSTFVKYVPAAVSMFDRDMRYLQVGDRWCADYGPRSSEMLGRQKDAPKWKFGFIISKLGSRFG